MEIIKKNIMKLSKGNFMYSNEINELGFKICYPTSKVKNVISGDYYITVVPKSFSTDYELMRDTLMRCLPTDEDGNTLNLLLEWKYNNLSNEELYEYITNKTDSYGLQLIGDMCGVTHIHQDLEGCVEWQEDYFYHYPNGSQLSKKEFNSILTTPFVTIEGRGYIMSKFTDVDPSPTLQLTSDGKYIITYGEV